MRRESRRWQAALLAWVSLVPLGMAGMPRIADSQAIDCSAALVIVAIFGFVRAAIAALQTRRFAWHFYVLFVLTSVLWVPFVLPPLAGYLAELLGFDPYGSYLRSIR